MNLRVLAAIVSGIARGGVVWKIGLLSGGMILFVVVAVMLVSGTTIQIEVTSSSLGARVSMVEQSDQLGVPLNGTSEQIKRESRWSVSEAKIISDTAYSDEGRPDCLNIQKDATQPISGDILLSGQVEVAINRVANGPLRIALSCVGVSPFCVTFKNTTRRGCPVVRFRSGVVIRYERLDEQLENGSLPIMIFRAKDLKLGNIAKEGMISADIVYSGKVTLFGKSLFLDRVYPVKTIDLATGDWVDVEHSTSDFFVLTTPFVEGGGGIKSVVRVDAKAIKVFGVGSANGRVGSISWYERIVRDPLLLGFWQVLVLVGFLVGVIASVRQINVERRTDDRRYRGRKRL